MAGLEDDIQQKQEETTRNTLLATVTGDATKTGEEAANAVQITSDAQDALDAENKKSEVLKTINEKNAFFDPANYITPTAPSGDKLSNEDYYPGLNQNVIQGYHQGKFFNSALVGSSNVAPMAVIAARKKELAQQAYAKAKNEEIARTKALSFSVTAAPQFIAELYGEAMLYTKEKVDKLGSYQALFKDPEYMETMRRFDIEGKKTLYMNERITQVKKDAQKPDRFIPPALVELYKGYEAATGDFNAKIVAKKIRLKEFSATDYADRADTYDNLSRWSDSKNLDNFVVTIKKEDISKMPKGMNDKYVKIGSTDQHVDKEAYLKGLAGFTKGNTLYNAGDPEAPTDSPEFKQWQKFSEEQWQADMKYKNIDEKTKEVKLEYNSARFSDNLAWMKRQDEKYNYYGEVEQKVTDKNRIVSFAQNTDAIKRRADYATYMKQFPTNKNNGYTTIQLGEPTNNKGTWSTNQAGITMKGGDGKFYTLTAEQIYKKGQDPKTGAEFRKNNKDVYEDAKIARQSKAGKSVVVSEEVGHFVRSSSGGWIPLELAGEGKHGDVTTMIVQKAKIVTGYKKVADPNNPGLFTQEPIVSNTTFTITKPIGEQYEKANLLNHKATSTQVGASTVY